MHSILNPLHILLCFDQNPQSSKFILKPGDLKARTNLILNINVNIIYVITILKA